MSMFRALMGDLEDHPIFGSHMQSIRHMNNMMNSLFADPFGMMGSNALTDSHRRSGNTRTDLMPFGFPPMPSFDMDRLFTQFDDLGGNPNGHVFMSRSMMTMTQGPDGHPQVYQESMSTKTAPGGVKETKKTVCDSRTGTKKMAIGHHIGDRAHILEREQNMHNGEAEERQEFINLDEEEAETFNREWESRTRRSLGAIDAGSYRPYGAQNRSHTEHRQLALPDPSASRHSSRSRRVPSSRRGVRSAPSKSHGSGSSPRPKNSADSVGCSPKADKKVPSLAAETATASTATATVAPSKPRKREHSPDAGRSNKRHTATNDD